MANALKNRQNGEWRNWPQKKKKKNLQNRQLPRAYTHLNAHDERGVKISQMRAYLASRGSCNRRPVFPLARIFIRKRDKRRNSLNSATPRHDPFPSTKRQKRTRRTRPPRPKENAFGNTLWVQERHPSTLRPQNET
jgi:hypothetical protein